MDPGFRSISDSWPYVLCYCYCYVMYCTVMLLECYCLKFAALYLGGRLLWWEDWSAICSVITQWSESLRTRKHILLSHLRLPQPGGPCSRIYIPQEQGGPVISPGTRFSIMYDIVWLINSALLTADIILLSMWEPPTGCRIANEVTVTQTGIEATTR
jgi:hypothetical protein